MTVSTRRGRPPGAPRTWQPAAARRRPRSEDGGPDGAAVLMTVGLVAAPLVLLCWGVLHATLGALRARWWLALLPAAVAAAWTTLAGYGEVATTHLEVYRGLLDDVAAYRWDSLRHGWASRLADWTPLSVQAAGLATAASRGWVEARRPSWRRKDRRATRRRKANRTRRRLQQRGAARADAVILGVDPAGDPVAVTDEQLAAHALLVGASGSGKTTSWLHLAGALIQRGHPVVAIDLKGDPAVVERLRAEAAAARTGFHLWTPQGPAVWNPLARGDATRLKDKLIAGEEFTEPHYRRAAERHLQLTLSVLLRRDDTRPPTLDEVVALLDPARLGRLVRDLPDDDADRLQTYLDGLTRDQESAIRGLQNRLALVTESSAAFWLAAADGDPATDDALDVRAAIDAGDVVVWSLPSGDYPELAALIGAMAVIDLQTVAAGLQRDSHAGRCYVVVDEFSALAGDHLLGLLARGRGAGVSVLLATQELADLQRAAPQFTDQVLGNTLTKIVHRVDVPESAERLAAIAGTEQGWEETIQVSHDSTPGRSQRGAATGLGSLRQVDQFIVHPNVLKGLACGQAVLITKAPAPQVQLLSVVAVPHGPGHRLPPTPDPIDAEEFTP